MYKIVYPFSAYFFESVAFFEGHCLFANISLSFGDDMIKKTIIFMTTHCGSVAVLLRLRLAERQKYKSSKTARRKLQNISHQKISESIYNKSCKRNGNLNTN